MPIPTVRLHLDELFSIIKDGPDADENPDLIGRNVTITLTPQLTDRTLVPVEGDPHGYWPEVLRWKVGPAPDADMDWPFTALVPNLADPAMLTDADRYTVVVATTDSPQYTTNRSISSGVVLTPEDTGTTIDLMPLLPVAAATPTSPVVKGDEGPPGPPGPVPVLSADATTLTPGSDATAVFTGPPGAPTLLLGVPRGDKGDPGDPTPFQLRGPGRPDQPATTDGVITGSEPVGTEYVSLDGAGVGAWVWRKRPGATGWQVVDGDTGEIDASALIGADWVLNPTQGVLYLRRIGERVTLTGRFRRAPDSPEVGRAVYSNLTQSLPTEFRIHARGFFPVGQAVAGGVGPVSFFASLNYPVVSFTSGTWAPGDSLSFTASWLVSRSWPSTLAI